MSTNDPQKLQEVVLTVKLRLSKDLKELTDLVGGRLWMMDGVEDVTVSKENASPVSTQQQEELRELETPLLAYDFEGKIRDFNKMYGLPVLEVPGFPPYMNRGAFIMRMHQFKTILDAEVKEVDDIIDAVRVANEGESIIHVLTMLADWLGDIQVYCASEMRKFGLSNDMILSIIMASNMSKLGKDGKPIIVDGKVQKGPNYWKPEPMLSRYIEAAVRQADKESGL